MNCSHLTVASTDTVTYDNNNNSNNLLSPVVPQSSVSQPTSPLSSDYCIDTLFDDDFQGTSIFHTEPYVPISTSTKSLINFTGKTVSTFPVFGYATYEEVSVLKSMKYMKLYSPIKLI